MPYHYTANMKLGAIDFFNAFHITPKTAGRMQCGNTTKYSSFQQTFQDYLKILKDEGIDYIE